jgi:uncharacterized membrane protein
MASKKGSKDIFSSIFGLVLAVVFFGLGLWQTQSVLYEVKHFSKTEGQVVDVVSIKGRRGVTFYSPQVRFLSQSGEVVIFVERTQNSNNTYQKGDRVKVLYNPENPADARVSVWWSLYLVPFSFVIIGGVTLVLMIGILAGKISKESE